jgi:hypothetical protein
MCPCGAGEVLRRKGRQRRSKEQDGITLETTTKTQHLDARMLLGNLFKLQGLLLAQLELLILGELVDLRNGKRGLLDFHREDVLGAKAGVDVEQTLKTPKQEARAYERNESHRDFGDHKQVTRLVVSASAPG